MRAFFAVAHTAKCLRFNRNICKVGVPTLVLSKALSSHTNLDIAEPIEDQVKQDHAELKNNYDQYKSSGDKRWYNQFVYELSRHSVGEELILYPLLESLGPKGKELTDKARKEHHKAKEILSRMEIIADGPKEPFDKEFDTLFAELEQHMKTEEAEDLKLIADNLSVEDRLLHGKKFQNRKKIVPTRPHPSAPEKPVLLEEAMGLLAAPIDKFRDLFRDFPSDQEQQKQQQKM